MQILGVGFPCNYRYKLVKLSFGISRPHIKYFDGTSDHWQLLHPVSKKNTPKIPIVPVSQWGWWLTLKQLLSFVGKIDFCPIWESEQFVASSIFFQFCMWWQLKYFLFSPWDLGEDEPILTIIFFNWVGFWPPSRLEQTKIVVFFQKSSHAWSIFLSYHDSCCFHKRWSIWSHICWNKCLRPLVFLWCLRRCGVAEKKHDAVSKGSI